MPFKTTNIPFQEIITNSTIENFLSQIDTNQLYTTLSFGSPSKNIDIYLSMEQLAFSILSNNCLRGSYSSYDPSLSNTFKNETPYTNSIGFISKACIATEQCSFYNNINLTENINSGDFKFYLGNNSSPKSQNNIDSDRLCGIAGLIRSSFNNNLNNYNLIYFLKKNGIIDSYSWGIFYFDKENSYNVDKDIQSKYDGLLIAGITNNTYLDIFKTKNVYNSYAYDSFFWSLHFNKIYFNDSEAEYVCSNNTRLEFVIDMNYITSDRSYYENIKKYFFKKYLDEKICVEEKVYKTYEENNYMIICNTEFKSSLSSFPKIYFYSEKYPYVLNLDYNDVFIELNNKIYFLIIFKEAINTLWRVGKIFMKKYPFIFDYDQKTISFVQLNKFGGQSNKEEEKENNIWEKIKIYVFIILLIIAVIIGVFIGKYIWKKQRKKRANELNDDNYEYIEKFDINK